MSSLIGNSAQMQLLHRRIARLGKSRWPVLIQGETGTGKELVARAIHDAGKGGPFVVVDCSSLVGPLMESELFGYAKGAFTGAHQSKLGLLDAAHGGTAFFDEIGELPLELQMKLLRVLQEKEFRQVGGLGQRRSDFRVIAATHRDLAIEVEQKRFRQDLYYRLNVTKLRVSPLRERKEDIPLLVRYFLDRYGMNHEISGEIMSMLLTYDWPGNVRELEHLIQRMIAMNSGPYLHTADLPTRLSNHSQQPQVQRLLSNSSSENPFDPGTCPVLPLAEVEKSAILQAIVYTKGDRGTAAALLGIGRTTLYRKLKEYEHELPEMYRNDRGK